MKVEKFCFLVFSRAAADFEDPKASFVSKRLVTFTFSYEFPLRFINNFFAAILSRVYEMIFSPSRQADMPNVVCLLDYIFHQIDWSWICVWCWWSGKIWTKLLTGKRDSLAVKPVSHEVSQRIFVTVPKSSCSIIYANLTARVSRIWPQPQRNVCLASPLSSLRLSRV